MKKGEKTRGEGYGSQREAWGVRLEVGRKRCEGGAGIGRTRVREAKGRGPSSAARGRAGRHAIQKRKLSTGVGRWGR